MSSGVVLDDGVKTQPAVIHVVVDEPGRTVLEITLHEGRNRQIRRMCEAVGLEVIRLKRSAEGPVKLGMLQPGEYRELKKNPRLVPCAMPRSKAAPRPAKPPLPPPAAPAPSSTTKQAESQHSMQTNRSARGGFVIILGKPFRKKLKNKAKRKTFWRFPLVCFSTK